MKISPKSCSCQHCSRGKHTKTGHFFMRSDERANRRAVNSELAKLRNLDYNITYDPVLGYLPKFEYQLSYIDSLDIPNVPQGNRYD